MFYVSFFYVAVVRVEPLKQTCKPTPHYPRRVIPTFMVLYTQEKPVICCQRQAACGQEPVNTEAPATKADHKMSQIKNSKFHSHWGEKYHTTATPRYCLLVSTWYGQNAYSWSKQLVIPNKVKPWLREIGPAVNDFFVLSPHKKAPRFPRACSPWEYLIPLLIIFNPFAFN